MRLGDRTTGPTPAADSIRIEMYDPAGGARPPAVEGDRRSDRDAAPRGARLVAAHALIAVSVIVAALIAVFVIAFGRADDPATRPASTAPAEVGALPGFDPDALPSADAAGLPFPGGRLSPGRYASDLLGVPLSFTVAEPTAVRTARPGAILLTPMGTGVGSVGETPHVMFLRLGGWNTAAEAGDPGFHGVGTIDPYDIDAWIADNVVIVHDEGDLRVDSRAAKMVELHVDPSSELGHGICEPGTRPCFWFASPPEPMIQPAAIRLDGVLYGTTTVRLWLIAIDDAEPLLVVAAALADDDTWLEEFDAATIGTLEIGDVAPYSLDTSDVGSDG